MIEQIISRRLQIPLRQVQGTVRLLREGATIPFISRYRKEATGSLDEVQVASVKEWLDRLTELETRKQTVLTTIEGQGRLTPELRRRIAECWDAVELEDIYLPYKPKRRTRATVARERGLEPLAEIILAQQSRNVVQQARRFVSAEVPTPEEALAGACDIVAERISEDERARNTLRRTFAREGIVHSKLVKGKETEGAKYADYFDAATPLRSISSHRFLAMRRGEEEGILKIAVDVDAEHCIESLRRLFVRPGSATREWMEAAVADSFKRLIRPSIETEQLAAAKEKGLLRSEGKEYVVKDGDVIEAGHQLTYGALNPHEVLRIRGADAVYNYLIQEVLRVYRQQGVDINDKHIEIIVRQMMRKVRIDDSGSTNLLSGAIVDLHEFRAANRAIAERIAAGETELTPATAEHVLMGITKASLATESFLSAASFQETTKVLTDAAIKGKIDHLVGLKENVIIGKLIPAGSGLACYRNFETNEEPAVPAEPEDDGVDLSDLANISNAL